MKVVRRPINKVFQQIIIVWVSLMIFTGCGNNLFDKAVDQGKLAVEDQNYGKAKASFELALQEKDDSHTRNMLQQVD